MKKPKRWLLPPHLWNSTPTIALTRFTCHFICHCLLQLLPITLKILKIL